MSDDTTAGPALRIGHVRGVTPDKWRRIWAERFDEPLLVEEVADTEPLAGVREGRLDMCFVRLPIDRDGLHAIPLYEEQLVAWTSKEHVFAAVDEVTMADLADEQVLTEMTPGSTDLVLGGAVLLVPMSIARGASRRDLTYRPVVDAEPAPVALVWRVDDDNPLIDEFIGVVRGRAADSPRTQQQRVTAEGRRSAAPSPAPRGAGGRSGGTRGRSSRSTSRRPRRR